MQSKVINLFGSPGSGKTTASWYLAAKMKMSGVSVELTGEFAKSLTHSNRKDCLKSQMLILGKQINKIERLLNKYQYIIVDSPILLAAIYSPIDYPQNFVPFLLDFNKRFLNINFFINRVKPYNPIGRNQTELESNLLSKQIKDFLNIVGEKYEEIDGNEKGYETILEKLL